MGQFRRDPLTGRWVIINTDEIKSPGDFKIDKVAKKGGPCPFCYGSENMTPPEIMAFRQNATAPNTPGWSVRVVPNKYPALRVEGDLAKEGVGMFDKMNGIGAHEVIIETPDHFREIPDLEYSDVESVVSAYKYRCLDLKKDTRLKYLLLFKNYGFSAGASLEHGHTQLIALPIVPKRVSEALKGAARYYSYKDRCVFCDMVSQELEEKERIVLENDIFLAYCPFVSRFPYETRIIPKRHLSDFASITKEEIAGFARILKDVMKKIKIVLEDPPYNVVIHTSPIDGHEWARQDYHWHCDIMPKLGKVAGFEWGSGFYINPTPPEIAAESLRGGNESKSKKAKRRA